VNFAERGDVLPPLESTLNKSLAQAIASLPAADNILKGNPDLHSSYSRDYGQRGHHPLQRTSGIMGGPPMIHLGSITSGSADSAYSRAPPTHKHNFPSQHLIGPSGKNAGPHPIECINEYPATKYVAQWRPHQEEEEEKEEEGTGATMAGGSPFTKGGSKGARFTGVLDCGLGVSAMGTTRELYAGSSKASRDIRIPGYAGFVPASLPNQLALTGAPHSPAAKDHILQTYKHDKPGYTGHRPQCVVNERGPRTPRGKKRLNEGLVASLILDSMKI